MKKTLVSLLLVVMLAMTSLSGLAIYDIPEPYDMPISDGSVPQLVVYMSTETGYEKAYLSYDEHVAILGWEEATGMDFTFIHPPTNDDGSFFNSTIASGDLPDIWITGNWNSYYAGGIEGAINDGILLNLNEYIEKYGYHYLVEAHKNWDAQAEKNFMTDSGMYRFGAASQRVPVLGMQHAGMVIREDLLDKLGLDMPETVDQFHDAMVAMKEAGLVEIPIALEQLNSWYYSSAFFSNHLGITTNGMMIGEDGKVTYAMLEPAYKDWMLMMNAWYNEGLFDEDCISRTHSDAEAMVTSGRSAVVAIGNWETQEDIAVGKAACGEDFNLLGMTELAKDEDSIGAENPFCKPIENGTNGMYWGISTTNPNPVESFKALDWLYSYEGTELMVFGPTESIDMLHPEKGEVVTIHWTNEDGTRQFSDYMLHNPELEYNSIRYIYTIQNLSSEYASEMEYMQYGDESNEQCWEAWTKNATNVRTVPSCISLTAEESQKQAPIRTNIESFIWEKIYNIIFGEDSIDNWDGYVQELYGMGLQDWIDIQQAATDRYWAR
ncbi:MAG: extracellular solute-binding protein [Christensenellales bacterium]|jgi:putative aldouronate transport system substrate-binding protein